MKKFIFPLALFLIFVLAVPAYADHKQDVLGETTEELPQISPTADGPGLILPDSPLYFLDHFKQNLRLMFAVTPESKAKVHSDVAGERLAELRFMLAKNNQAGIDKALTGVSENIEKAVLDLEAAKLTGKDVSKLAESINTDIKEKQESLEALSESEDREIMFKGKAIQEKLLKAKLDVEDSLPLEVLEGEIERDITKRVEDHAQEASDSAKGLTHSIDVLNRLASSAAEKQQTKREEALKRAIETKNEILKKQYEQRLAKEKIKYEEALKVRNQASEEAKKSYEAAKKAAMELRRAEELKRKEIQNEGPKQLPAEEFEEEIEIEE